MFVKNATKNYRSNKVNMLLSGHQSRMTVRIIPSASSEYGLPSHETAGCSNAKESTKAQTADHSPCRSYLCREPYEVGSHQASTS